MANYNNLKTAIQAVIKANGNQEITGDILQNALMSMINSLGAGYQFIGVATPETNPSTPDQKVFYVANGKGTYANFGGLIVDEDEVIILYYDTGWHKLLTGIASQTKLTELAHQVASINIIEIVSGNNSSIYENIYSGNTAPKTEYIFIAFNLGQDYSNLSVDLATSEASAHITQNVYSGAITVGKYTWKVPYNGEKYIRFFTSAGSYPSNSSFVIGIPDAIDRLWKESLDELGLPKAIDDNPTSNSSNFVKSGGVKQSLDTVSLMTKKFPYFGKKIRREVDAKVVYGSIWDEYSSGDDYSARVVVRSDGCRYELIPISTTGVYYYYGTSRPQYNSLVLYLNSDLTIIGSQISGDGTNQSQTGVLLEIPDNAAFIAALSFIVDGFQPLRIDVEDYEYKFATEKDMYLYQSKNVTPLNISLNNTLKRLQCDGSVQTASSGAVSDIVAIDKTKTYQVTTEVDKWRCGVAYYNDATGNVLVGYQISAPRDTTITEILDIPGDANYMRFCSVEPNIFKIDSIELTEAMPLSKLTEIKDLEQQVNNIPNLYVGRYQGQSNYGKVLVIGADGNVVLGSGGGTDPTANSVVEHIDKTLYLGADLIDNPNIILGEGWTGTLADGLTHKSGNVAIAEIQAMTIKGKKYLVECTLSSAAEASIYLSIGDGPLVDVYNGTTTIKIGFISNGGYLKITPMSSFDGSVSNIHVKEVVNSEDAVETLPIEVRNIDNGTTKGNITGFWNVAIGSFNTLSKNQNGSRNIVIGYSALPAFESGTRNVCIGTFAGANLKTGDHNIALGADSLYFIQNGQDNISIGKASMGRMELMEANRNVAIGSAALGELQSGASDNVALGDHACNYSNANNVGVGSKACYWTRGKGNVCVGYYAQGAPWITGDNNIAIGNHSQCGTPGTADDPMIINNAIAIGYNANATKSNQVVIGNKDNTEFVLGTKKLIFNADNSISWETIS